MIALALALLVQAEPAAKDSPWYPLAVGTAWHYRAGDAKLVARVTRHEKMGGTMCALVETLRDERLVASEHLAAKDDGVYRFAYDRSALDPPLRVLKLPPKKDDAWDVASSTTEEKIAGRFTVRDAEVEVPAGKYKTLAVDAELTVNERKLSVTYYFAEGVGLVKLASGGVVIELEKYEAPKKP